jgi:ubiquinone/menaquinone biosynthesis C-methylase UbiE
MVRVGRRARPGISFVAASGIDLPFGDGAFDIVVANFVVSHFPNYETGLFEMIRVLKPGGRLAVSAWSDAADELQQAWGEVIEEFVPKELLEPVWAEAAPWHDRFRDRDLFEKALIDAEMQHVRTEPAEYHFVMSQAEYLEGVEAWATGRFVRSMLGEDGWTQLKARARDVFADRFADPLNDFQSAILGVGTKP